MKFLVLMLFAFAIGRADSVLEFAVAAFYGIFLAAVSGRTGGDFARRLLVVELPLLILPLTMPLSVPGNGPEILGLTYSLEGLKMSMLILLRVFLLTIVLVSVFASEYPYAWFSALNRMGMPEKLVLICRLSYRYIWVILDEYRKLWNALKVRGFCARFDRRTYRAFSWLFGMLLVRSYERGLRVSKAMKLRWLSEKWMEQPRRAMGSSGLAMAALLLAGAGGCLVI